MDKSSSTGIDDDDSIFHFCNRFFIDQVLVFREERAVQRDDVCLFVDCFKVGIDALCIMEEVLVPHDVVDQHIHPKSSQQADDDRSYLSASNDANRSPMQFSALESSETEVIDLRLHVYGMKFAKQREDKANSVLCDRIRRVFWHSDDLQLPCCRPKVDVIIPIGPECKEANT